MSTHFDLIWIGTGQATMSIVPRALKAGLKVAVIEGDKFGGTCVNNGCTPTKTLVAAARAIFQAQRGDDFGFKIDNLTVDFEKLMAPQKANRARATQNIEKHLRKYENCTVFEGYASFVDEHHIEINGQRISGDHIVINTGTRPRDPEVSGVENIDWLNNKSLLDLNELPKHLAIVGGSYIGLEFAQIFKRLGSEVSVFVRGDQLMPREDSDIADIADDVLSSEGVNLIYNCELQSVSQDSTQQITVNYQQADEKKSLSASHILFAIGRQSNSDLLKTDKANLETDKRGFIQVNETVQSNHPHIYAVGDVNGRGAFTHTSVNDGEIFWDHFSRKLNLNTEKPELDRTLSMRTLSYAMFIDPPLAQIGINEKTARASERNILMASMAMKNISRAVEKQETKGLIKIFVDADSEEFLGATIFGTGGDEVIAAFVPFMQAGASYKTFRRSLFPHPTVGELLPWILDNLKPLD